MRLTGGVAAESGAVNRPVSAAAAVVILKKSDAGRPQAAVCCVWSETSPRYQRLRTWTVSRG